MCSQMAQPQHYGAFANTLSSNVGPLVRIGPNEVSYYSVNTYDAIHKVGSKYRKDPRVYGEFVQDGSPSLFTTTCVLASITSCMTLIVQ